MASQLIEVIDRERELGPQNPLLDGLPVPTIREAQVLLNAGGEARPDHFWRLPLVKRLESLGDLRRIFIAVPKEAAYFQRLVISMRSSYERRNPNDPQIYAALVGIGNKLGRAPLRPLCLPNAISDLALIAAHRGYGLSSFLQRMSDVLGTMPRRIDLHGRDGGTYTQIPSLRVQWPICGTEQGLARAILAEIDARYSTSFFEKALTRGAKPEHTLSQAQILLSIVNLGMLLIDNVKINDLECSPSLTLFAVLERLSTETGIPISIAADASSIEYIKRRESVFFSAGANHFQIFNSPRTCDESVAGYVNKCWQLRISHPAECMPTWLPDVVYEMTQGRFKVVSTLLHELFRDMANRPKDLLTPERVQLIARRSIAPYVFSTAMDRHEEKSIRRRYVESLVT